MYSGTTLTKFSGRVMGAHQKIDRIARRHLSWLVGYNNAFPSIKMILHFEGKNGPDAIKRKSPAKDELWHYFNPFDDSDTGIVDIIDDHYKALVRELKAQNTERSAFEASWLSHAIVDGLTPAHHFPYEEKLTEIRGGNGIDSRTSIKAKIVMPGETPRQKVKNNWRMWGPKGLMTTHGLFELGVASIIAPLSFSEALPDEKDRQKVQDIGISEWFKQVAREIAVLDMYTRYQQKGWTPKLAYEVRHKLGPLIINCVTLAWYLAVTEVGKIGEGVEDNIGISGRKNV